MTISYSGNFVKLLFRWRGSLWKAVWKELVIFLIAYYLVRIIFEFILKVHFPEEAKDFVKVSIMFEHYLKFIPLTFLLGFYISSVVARWWQQFNFVAWPDDVLNLICFVIPDSDEKSKLTRHRIGRYLCLTCALGWRDISVQVRQRFPTVEHLVKTGLMTEKELEIYRSVSAENIRWALPLQWIQRIIRRLLTEGKVPPPLAGAIMKEIMNFRSLFHKLYCYDWVCIPLVYTHVTTVATYGYFAFCLLGRQFVDEEKEKDFYVPIFTILQFLFYIGWFKVGQELMRPFGTDDDDIELNYLLNRHVQAVFATLEFGVREEPPEEFDQFWGKENVSIGHTKLSLQVKEHPPKLHAKVVASKSDEEIVDVDEMEKLIDRQKRLEKKNLRTF